MENKSPEPIGFGYAQFQLAKALAASQSHSVPESRAGAIKKVNRWMRVIKNIVSGQARYGSRVPFVETPVWLTPEVIKGGFATGEWLAGGELCPHERLWLEKLPCSVKAGQERQALNSFFITDDGLNWLGDMLKTGQYQITVPEEGALLTIAWLAQNGGIESARDLVDQISPWFSQIRFYPAPAVGSKIKSNLVRLKNVAAVKVDLSKVESSLDILKQREAVEVWNPFMDQMVALALELIDGSGNIVAPSREWMERAAVLRSDYTRLRREHPLNKKPENIKKHFAQLLRLIGMMLDQKGHIEAAESARFTLIVKLHLKKHDLPDSEKCMSQRRQQRKDVDVPLYGDISQVLLKRLGGLDPGGGFNDRLIFTEPVNKAEASLKVPMGTVIPTSLRIKIQRAWQAEISDLIRDNIISSAEVLADVLPQLSSRAMAAGLVDENLQYLYESICLAFSRRRSLLLLNLEKQVSLNELPWLRALDDFKSETLKDDEMRGFMREIAVVTLSAFPQYILPNKLLREYKVLAGAGQLDLPLTEELAADIFMGAFTEKFVRAAQDAAKLLSDGFYSLYFRIDFEEIKRLTKNADNYANGHNKEFLKICENRAGVKYEKWCPPISGMIIEQQQIISTHNLSSLFLRLNIDSNAFDVLETAKSIFKWVCTRQQARCHNYHAGLLMIKQSAYAWRQMVFFLSLVSDDDRRDFLVWARGHFLNQPVDFIERFSPAFKGFQAVVEGAPLAGDARIFTGWETRHWLMPAELK